MTAGLTAYEHQVLTDTAGDINGHVQRLNKADRDDDRDDALATLDRILATTHYALRFFAAGYGHD